MLHKVFYSQLKSTISQASVCFGELLLAFLPHMKIYAEFIRNHDKSSKVSGISTPWPPLGPVEVLLIRGVAFISGESLHYTVKSLISSRPWDQSKCPD